MSVVNPSARPKCRGDHWSVVTHSLLEPSCLSGLQTRPSTAVLSVVSVVLCLVGDGSRARSGGLFGSVDLGQRS